jgi:diguanylate cyclase (GGDEF)-like protein
MINNRRSVNRDVRIEDKLYFLAYYDQLTKMPNEKYFYNELEQKMKNNNNNLAIVYLKINNLEDINNILGFKKRNSFIILLTEYIQAENKSAELISLYRGNQFLLLYNLDDFDQKIEIALDNLLLKLNNFIKENNYDYLLNINLGTALYPDHGATAAELLSKAHNAMYTANNKANSYQIYDENVFLKKVEEESLKQDLKEAIENKDLYLEYQPKVRTDDEAVTALEALIRWQHQEKGEISPGEFIPLAEKTGLIKYIGVIVLKEVFETLKLWQQNSLNEIKMCINISLIELNDPEVLENIKHIANSYSIDNSLIEFEITERSFIELSESILEELKEMGFSIALDDFGTGYSSLGFLNKLSIDLLKLDKSFIDNIDVEKTKMLVEGVIDISHRLGLEVVAEGVENKD